jgi:hypothetical protein
MKDRTIPAVLTATAIIVGFLVLIVNSALAQAPEGYRIEVPLVNHLQAGMNEQDIYIEREPGSHEVFRVTADDADMTAMLYAAAEPVAHNPTDPTDVGPYPKGLSLGITLGDWLAGSGTASISCEGDSGRFTAEFQDLVPGGVYTLWTFFLARPFPEVFATYDLPLGARAGTDNIFEADAEGRASLDVETTPCVQLSGDQLLSGLAAAYHSDGLTYGPLPGDFGTISHLQVLNFLPTAEELAGN